MRELSNEELAALAEKWLNGSISPEEEKLFNEWYEKDPGAQLVLETQDHTPEAFRARVLNNIQSSVFKKRTPFIARYKWAAAASILVLLSVAGYVFFNREADNTTIIASSEEKILPGYDRAYLTLSDGRKIILDAQKNETISDGHVAIAHQQGLVNYQHAEAAVTNTMMTPRGGQYKLVLADGTQVWLNAASSITYPTAFTGNTREVEITGEAFFEVAKDRNKPFIVSFGNKRVEVLGTTFNINCYPEEQASKTTLVEGSIRIQQAGNSIILQPSEQAVVDKRIIVNKKPDLRQVLAWKNGRFDFNEQDFATSMRQLERWYDINVVYDGTVPQELFYGRIGRNLTLQEVIEGLNGVIAKFRLEGRTLHVLAKQ